MHTKAKGDIGETVCIRLLQREGFAILARNYRKKWGELDIVALKDGMLHFFEVKSTTMSRGIGLKDTHRPEENVHQAKLAALRRTIQTFLAETGRGVDTEFYFHVFAVHIDMRRKVSAVRWIKNVVL